LILKLRVNRFEIMWSIPIILILAYLVYYGINARKITNECLSYCSTFSKLYAWKIDGDFFGAFVLDKDKIYCSCYYPNSNFPFANATIAEIENGGGYHN